MHVCILCVCTIGGMLPVLAKWWVPEVWRVHSSTAGTVASSSVTSPSPTRCSYTHHVTVFSQHHCCTHIHTLCVQSRETLNVSQFHITNWAPDGSCSNIKTVTDVIDEIIKVQIRTGNKPITVHCRFILVLLTVVLTDHVCMCAVTQ